MKKITTLLAIAFCIHANAQIITTVVGNGTQSFSGDGGQATAAAVNDAAQTAFDASGNLYFADAINSRIRKVTSAGIITTVAGNTTYGYSGDGGAATAAKINYAGGVAIDGAGNMYIADGNNYRIRKVNTAGIITTYAGTGTYGYSGDGGQATAAGIDQVGAVICDAAGNVYFNNPDYNYIRKITTAGIISTVVGNGAASFSGDGGQATAAAINNPIYMAFDAAGNLYFSDFNNSRIRKVTPAGIISTVVGNGTNGYAGDGGPATAAELSYAEGVFVDGAGNIYIGDQFNNR